MGIGQSTQNVPQYNPNPNQPGLNIANPPGAPTNQPQWVNTGAGTGGSNYCMQPSYSAAAPVYPGAGYNASSSSSSESFHSSSSQGGNYQAVQQSNSCSNVWIWLLIIILIVILIVLFMRTKRNIQYK